MPKNILITCFIALSTLAITGCSSTTDMISQTFGSHYAGSQPYTGTYKMSDEAFWEGSSATVWDRLTHIPLTQLDASANTSDNVKSGWIKLAIISKRYSTNSKDLTQHLTAWRSEYPSHPGNSLFPSDSSLTSIAHTPLPQRIALLVPLQGPSSASGQAVRDGFLGAYYESLAKTHVQQTISFYDTTTNPNINALYQQAVSEGADFVVGPLIKNDVQSLANSGSFRVPTLELNYTDNSSLSNNLYQFGLSPLDEAQQVADKAMRNGLSRAIIIAPQNDWGKNTVKTLTTRWKSLGGSVTEVMYFTPQSNLNQDVADLLHINIKQDREKMKNENNKAILEKQRRQDFDVIFLLAQPESAREIVPLLKYYYADNIPIYATSSIYSGAPNATKDQDLKGVIYCDIPWVLQMNRSDRLFAVGHDAYLISAELPRLTQMPNFPIYASTGALTLTSSHQIYRRLPWTQVNAGRP